MQPIDVEVRLSFLSSNMRGDHCSVLTITDNASRSRFVELELTPNMLSSILASAGAVTKAEVLDPEHYSRVGKNLVVSRIDLPKDKFRLEREVTDEMREFAQNVLIQSDDPSWTSYDWRRTNSGWDLHVRRYEDLA
jgi:hypothetical protein